MCNESINEERASYVGPRKNRRDGSATPDLVACGYLLTDVHVEPEDITTLFDAFRICDPALLLDALLESHSSLGISVNHLGKTAWHALLYKVKSTLSVMAALEPDPADTINKIIVPFQWFEYGGQRNAITRMVSSRVLDLSAYRDWQEKYPSRMRPHSQVMSLPEFATLIDESDAWLESVATDGIFKPLLSEMSDKSWAQNLGRQIWMPSTLCEFENYCVLANAFWAMTYEGLLKDFSPFAFSRSPLAEGSLNASSIQDARQKYEMKMIEFAALLNYNGSVAALDAAKLMDSLCA